MNKKILIILGIIVVFLAFYTLSLRNNIKLQKEINTSLESQICAINKKNEILYQDFLESQKQKDYYNKRYETIRIELEELGKKKGNECINEIVSEDLINILKNN